MSLHVGPDRLTTERFSSTAGSQCWRLHVLTDLSAFRSLGPDWTALADKAAEPNVFYEPWMLLPALELLQRQTGVELWAVYRERRGEQQLTGLFPFERRPNLRGLLGADRRSLRPHYCSLCTPLVHRDWVGPTLSALMRALQQAGGRVEFRLVGGDGEIGSWLQARASAGNGATGVRTMQRAALRRYPNADSYQRAAFSASGRAELRRQERRLRERGEVRFENLDRTESADPWIETFLRLEASGWKRSSGTAFAAKPQSAAYFRQVCRDAHAQGRLQMHALTVDGQAIAQNCLLKAADGLFAFRIAYDERYARYSPGMLLSVWHSCRLHESDDTAWIDSCADQANQMVNRLWPERIRLLDVGFAFGTFAGLARRLVSRGAADSTWGVTVVPADGKSGSGVDGGGGTVAN